MVPTTKPAGRGINHSRNIQCLLLAIAGVALLILVVSFHMIPVPTTATPQLFTAGSCDPNPWSTCLAKWNLMERFYKERMDQIKSSKDPNIGAVSPFDRYEPTWDCGIKHRVGEFAIGDGAKFSCFTHYFLEQPQCLVYSIGSFNDISYEASIRKMSSHCEIHTYDCTLGDVIGQNTPFYRSTIAHNVSFHPICLGEPSKGDDYQMLDTIFNEHSKGRSVTYFKIDCEGCEYYALLPSLRTFTAQTNPISQLQIELHWNSDYQKEKIPEIFEAIEALDLRLYSKERNAWGCEGKTCVEASFISGAAAFQAHVHYECPSLSPEWKAYCKLAGVPGCQ